MKKTLIKIWLFLIHQKIWIALGAMSIVMGSYRVSGMSVSWAMVCCVGLGTFLVYRSQYWLSRRRIDICYQARPKRFVLWGSGVVILLTLLISQVEAGLFVFLAVFSIPGFLYGLPMGFKGRTYQGLRSMPYLKVPLVVVTWMFLVCLPWLDGQPAVAMPWAYLGMMCAYLTALTLLFDLRDLESDVHTQGIKTISGFLGRTKTMRLIYALLFLSLTLSLISGLIIQAISAQKSAYFACIQVLMIFLASKTKTPRTKEQSVLWFEGVLDGVLISV